MNHLAGRNLTRMTSIATITLSLSKLGLSQPTALPSSYPDFNVYDLLRNYVADELSLISSVDKSLILQSLDSPNSLDKGDLIIPLPRLKVKGNIKEKAVEWSENFNKGSFIKKVVAEGVFLQFFIDRSLLYSLTINDVLSRKNDYGYLPLGEGKSVIVEFSSPNIAKPFHAGHLRSTIIGGYLANLYEKVGWKVTRINYLGDWGKQYGILALGFEKYGNESELESNPIQHLFEVYVKINQDIKQEFEESESDPKISETDNLAREYFKKMEDGEEKALGMWKKFRDLSIDKYIDTYARLNIHYDVYSGESQVSKESMDEVIETFYKKDLIHEDRGAKLIDLTKFNKKLGKCLVQKKDGTSLYLTRDCGEAIRRYEQYKFDKMIYVIASQQDLHAAQFFEILKQMGFEWAKDLQHINFGMVEGMSTRNGTVVFLDNILEKTKESMHEIMKKNEGKYAQIENPEKVADLIGISAVMIQDMQAKRINNYKFNWDRMFSFEGDTGPYLQYAHSRLCSVQRKSDYEESDYVNANLDLLTEECGENLVRVIAQYPDVLRKAMSTQEPSTVVTYLFNLTHLVSQCYDVMWVAGQDKDVAVARLALYMGAKQVLYNGMTLLGLTPVERM